MNDRANSIVMLILLPLLAIAPNCDAVEAAAQTPPAYQARQFEPSELPGIAPLSYSGQGIELRSAELWFAAIEIDAKTTSATACNLDVDAPTGWEAGKLIAAARPIRFSRRAAPVSEAPGATLATRVGATPRLPGLVLGASWPIYADGRRFFIGAMHHRAGRQNSTLVVFPDRAGKSTARAVAALPFHIDAVSVVPGLHGSAASLYLESKDIDRWRRIILQIDTAAYQKLSQLVP